MKKTLNIIFSILFACLLAVIIVLSVILFQKSRCVNKLEAELNTYNQNRSETHLVDVENKIVKIPHNYEHEMILSSYTLKFEKPSMSSYFSERVEYNPSLNLYPTVNHHTENRFITIPITISSTSEDSLSLNLGSFKLQFNYAIYSCKYLLNVDYENCVNIDSIIIENFLSKKYYAIFEIPKKENDILFETFYLTNNTLFTVVNNQFDWHFINEIVYDRIEF